MAPSIKAAPTALPPDVSTALSATEVEAKAQLQPQVPQQASAASAGMPCQPLDIVSGLAPNAYTDSTAGASLESRLQTSLQQAAQPLLCQEQDDNRLQAVLEQAVVPEGLPAAAAPMALSMALLEAAEQATQDLQWEEDSRLADEVVYLPDSMREAAQGISNAGDKYAEESALLDVMATTAQHQLSESVDSPEVNAQRLTSSNLAEQVAALPDEAATALAHQGVSATQARNSNPKPMIMSGDNELVFTSSLPTAVLDHGSSNLTDGVEQLPDRVTETAAATDFLSPDRAERVLFLGTQPSAMLDQDIQSSGQLAEEVADLPDSIIAVPATHTSRVDSPSMSFQSSALLDSKLQSSRQLAEEVAHLPEDMQDTALLSADQAGNTSQSTTALGLSSQASAPCSPGAESSSKKASVLPASSGSSADLMSPSVSQVLSPDRAEKTLLMGTQPSASLDRDLQSTDQLAAQVAQLPDSAAAAAAGKSLASTSTEQQLPEDTQPSAVLAEALDSSSNAAEEVAHLLDSMPEAASSNQHRPAESSPTSAVTHETWQHHTALFSQDAESSAAAANPQAQLNDAPEGLLHTESQTVSSGLAESSVADSLDSLHPGDWRTQWSEAQHQQQQHQPRNPTARTRPHEPTDLMRKIAAAATAKSTQIAVRPSSRDRLPATLKDVMLATAAQHRDLLSQLRPATTAGATASAAVWQDNHFAPVAKQGAESTIASSVTSLVAGVQVSSDACCVWLVAMQSQTISVFLYIRQPECSK